MPAVHERLLRSSDDFACPIDINFQGRFVIDVEFLDLKICPINVSVASFLLESRNRLEIHAEKYVSETHHLLSLLNFRVEKAVLYGPATA